MEALFKLLVFPGFIFLCSYAFLAEFIDRKMSARFQHRIGPPWFQPVADFIKLLAKEEIVPQEANPFMFKLMPILCLASAVTAFFYVPLWQVESLFPFKGDLIVVLYLLTVPTLTIFIGGWYSSSLYARIGSVRCLTQLFAYEVPLFLGLLAPALLANSWSLSEIVLFYTRHSWYWVFNLAGFGVSVITLLGKLEKVPFDIPEAETEIVAGSFTEYNARLFAFFRLAMNVEMVVGSALFAAVFLPFGFTGNPLLGFFIFMAKTIMIIVLLSLLPTILERIRIDQMIRFCWKYLVPVAFLQLFMNIILKGVLPR